MIYLFRAYITQKYHFYFFRQANIIILRKSDKDDYLKLKIYRLIVLLDILNKILKLIIIKKFNNIAERNNMLFFN